MNWADHRHMQVNLRLYRDPMRRLSVEAMVASSFVWRMRHAHAFFIGRTCMGASFALPVFVTLRCISGLGGIIVTLTYLLYVCGMNILLSFMGPP